MVSGYSMHLISFLYSFKLFLCSYVPMLMHPVSRAIVFLWYAIFLAFAAYGCSQIKVIFKSSTLYSNRRKDWSP